MKEKIKKYMSNGWKGISSFGKKAEQRLFSGRDFKKIWMFSVKYAYYIGLAVVLVILGIASNAYRNRMSVENDVPMTEPFSVSSVIMPEETMNPEPIAEENITEYIWPMNGGVITKFSDTAPIWSETLEQWQTHPAVDISASAGESVMACADGIVKDAYSDPLWGNVIIVGHADGNESVYANLSTLNLVEVGKKVKQGETISAVGKSASAEGEMPWHLHFALKNECGKYVDFSEYTNSAEINR